MTWAHDPDRITTGGTGIITATDGTRIPWRDIRHAGDGGDGDLQVESRGYWLDLPLHNLLHLWSMVPAFRPGRRGIVGDFLVCPCLECDGEGTVDWLPNLPGEPVVCVPCRGRGWLACGLVGQDIEE